MNRRIRSALLVGVLMAAPASGQSAAERLDEDAFLQGLIELELVELVDHYLDEFPPADPVVAQAAAISAARLHLLDPGLKPAARRRQLDALLAQRDALIARETDHPRRWRWQADQATDLCFERWPAGGTDVVVLFGAPTSAQRATAAELARRVPELIAGADEGVARAIRDIESAVGYRDDPALQQRRRRYARDERDRRLPFLDGIGLAIRATIETDDDDRRRAATTAARRLAPLRDVLEGDLLDQVRLYEAVARMELNEIPAAVELLDAIDTAGEAAGALKFMSQLARARAIGLRDGADVAHAYLDSLKIPAGRLFERLVMTDLRVRLAGAEADRGKGDVRSLRAYLELLDDAPPELEATMRDLVLARLAAALGPDADLSTLPALATIARAESILRSGGAPRQAISLVDAALKRSGVDAVDQARLLFLRGQALRADGHEHDAIGAFVELMKLMPATDEARRGIELAAALARRRHRDAPGDSAIRDQLRAVLEEIERSGSTLPKIATWRYARGRLALVEDQLDAAESALRSVGTTGSLAIEARYLLLEVQRRMAIRADDQANGRAAFDRRRQIADEAQALGGVIQTARRGATGQRADDLDFYRVRACIYEANALAFVEGPAAALVRLDELGATDDLDRDTLALLLRARIDAHRVLGNHDAARQDVATFLDAAPASSTEVLNALLRSVVDDHERLLDVGSFDAAATLARGSIGPLIKLIRDRTTPELERALADALRLTGDPAAALVQYDAIARRQPDTMEVLLGRAECLFALGAREQLGTAMGLYKRLAASAEDDRRTWWLCQLRMLQILDAVDRNTDQIMPRIKRLRLQDAALGGPRFRAAFERLNRGQQNR